MNEQKNEQVSELQEIKKTKWTEILKSQKAIMIGAAAVVAVAILVGLGIYNAPANRLNRQLDLGQKYLEEQNYEQAIVAFNQAIEIDDRCLEAYAGGIEAYLQSGNTEELSVFYEKALDAARSLEGEVLEENMPYVCSIYTAADDVYEDLNKITEILEEGLTVTEDNQEVKQELVENYIELAQQYEEDGAYTDSLAVYDRLLELDAQNTQVLEELGNCLTEYINLLINAKNYAEVKTLIEKYKGYELGIDFAALLTRIEELEKIEAENIAFMSNVYNLMSAEDYEGMLEVDGSDEARAFVERMESDYYVYIPEDETGKNGVGAGVYKFGEGGYYFFLGDYQNGERIGSGTSFMEEINGGYCLFTGEWKNDAPNGYGEEKTSVDYFTNSGSAYSRFVCGNLTNGLWDGEISNTINAHGKVYNLSYAMNAGLPTEDKTQDFLNEGGYIYYDDENAYIYAYEVKPSGSWVASNVTKGETLGTIGYGEVVEE